MCVQRNFTPSLCVSELPHIMGYSSFISVAVIKYLNKKQFRKEGVYFSWQFQVMAVTGSSLWGKPRDTFNGWSHQTQSRPDRNESGLLACLRSV